MNATLRIGQAIRILRQLKDEIESTWPHYHERPTEAKDVGADVEAALVDLERCCRADAPALDRLVARTTAVCASEK